MYMKYEGVNFTEYNLKTGKRGIRNKRYTYSVDFVDGKITNEYLFDRKKDPFEMHNIAAEKERIARAMFSQMKQRLVEVNDPAAVIERK